MLKTIKENMCMQMSLRNNINSAGERERVWEREKENKPRID